MNPDRPQPRRQVCGSCLYAEVSLAGDDPVLECRRYPPIIFGHGDQVSWSWPHMSSDDWCGEYRTDPAKRRTRKAPLMKTVMITGAGSGLGRAVALTLAAQGHVVYAGCQIRPQVTDLLRDGEALDDRLRAFRLDLDRENDIGHAAVIAQTQDVDVLFNNAGVIEAGALVDLDLDLIREVFEVNVFGTLGLTQLVLSTAMIPRRTGRVVFMSSVAGLIPRTLVGAYAASKHAVEAIAGTLRLELADAGIEVAVVNPELLDTGFDARAFEAHNDADLYDAPCPAEITRRLSQAHDPVDVIDDLCAAVIGDDPAYRTVLPTEARQEIHGLQSVTWAWSSGPVTPRLS